MLPYYQWIAEKNIGLISTKYRLFPTAGVDLGDGSLYIRRYLDGWAVKIIHWVGKILLFE